MVWQLCHAVLLQADAAIVIVFRGVLLGGGGQNLLTHPRLPVPTAYDYV